MATLRDRLLSAYRLCRHKNVLGLRVEMGTNALVASVPIMYAVVRTRARSVELQNVSGYEGICWPVPLGQTDENRNGTMACNGSSGNLCMQEGERTICKQRQ